MITWTPACGTAGSYGPFTLTATAATGEVGASNPFSIVVAHLVGTVTVAAIGDPQNGIENSLLTVTPSASTHAVRRNADLVGLAGAAGGRVVQHLDGRDHLDAGLRRRRDLRSVHADGDGVDR